ncbi:DUF4362 domain-containing protein [Aquibacillus koreensis]|uniref:DUF4362 domain-containing protein n=1 Tax=Aquibacillus koreensis TaxID=279446 RepID=A0A9X4ALU1_9BACI|nr:DUF4362 domain-containing protein [Aquibacillus koreensis]MCT2536094.1 DUF4362 domain-containing protein [Aquibacillus koreensis]MDC3422800.1 DUF4362 domain-containing protein [Aquibacillus koreensis]
MRILLILLFVIFLPFLSACNESANMEENIIGNPIKPYLRSDAVEHANENGDVILSAGRITNYQRLHSFLEHVEEGQPDSIRILIYGADGLPAFYNLVFNEKISYTYDQTQYMGDEPNSIMTTTCEEIVETEIRDKEAYVLSGCESDEVANTFLVRVELIMGIEGNIVKKSDSSLFIQDDKKEVEVKYTEETEFNSESKDEIKELKIGDEVRTWYSSQTFDTTPSKAIASRISTFVK